METPMKVDIKDKFCLTIDEACAYFHIGQKKMRKLASEQLNSGLFVQNGVKILVKRQRFESFLNDVTSI